MVRQIIGGVIVAVGLCGCGSPFLHPASTGASDATEIRAVIIGEASGPSTEPYGLSLTVHDDGECKTALRLEPTLTEIGGARYADVFLARAERDRLVGTYGFLAIPVAASWRYPRAGGVALLIVGLASVFYFHHPAAQVGLGTIAIALGWFSIMLARRSACQTIARSRIAPGASCKT